MHGLTAALRDQVVLSRPVAKRRRVAADFLSSIQTQIA